MATRHRPIRPRTAALVTAAAALAACRLFAPAAQSARTETPGQAPSASPTAFAPGPADSPTPPDAPQVETPGQATGFHGLVVPEDWYFTTAETGEIVALVFTPLDPADLAAFQDPEWMVPPDFAIAALVRSPLPPGADPAALQAGMEDSLANFSGEDLRSLLAGAGQVGLIDLSTLETVTLTQAELSDLGGRPSIAVRGEATFGPDLQPILQLLVHLAWTEDAFFTYYGIASDAVWEAVGADLGQIMETIVLP